MGLYPPRVSSNPPVVTRRYRTVEWFVDGENGSDAGTRPGNRPEKPLLTIAEAIDRCVSGEQNIINLIAPGHVTETNPIVIDKQFVTIRGWPSQNPGGQAPMTCVATVDASYFTIAAQDVVIRDMTIHGGASHPTIDYQEVPWSFRTGVHNVTFKAGTYGIKQGGHAFPSFLADAPSHGWAITECKFLPGLSLGGICLESNGSWGLIADCFFENMVNGILTSNNAQGAGVQILRNAIMTDVDTLVGAGIHLETNVSRYLVMDNVANNADHTASAQTPYFDAGTDNLWVRNVESGTGFTETAPD